MAAATARRIALILSLLAAAVIGCGPAPEADNSEAVKPEPPGPQAQAIPSSFKRTKSGGVRDTGDFIVRFEDTEVEAYQETKSVFQETRLLEDTARELNSVFSLPTNIPLIVRECGEVNAFYDSEAGEISLCYELIEHYFEIFMADATTDEEEEAAAISAVNATVFTLFHEMGHAMIDIYDLPITGREEDAVDQLATMILLQGGDEGEDSAIDGANSFLGDEEAEMDELAFADEHSLDDQRFYNILCWVYGENPDDYQYLVEDEFLPADRAERCPAEYDRLSRSWQTLLEPYVKDSAREEPDSAR